MKKTWHSTEKNKKKGTSGGRLRPKPKATKKNPQINTATGGGKLGRDSTWEKKIRQSDLKNVSGKIGNWELGDRHVNLGLEKRGRD